MPEIYLPFTLAGDVEPARRPDHGDPPASTRAVVSQVYAIDRNQPVTDVKTLDVVLARTSTRRRASTSILLSVFAALGLVLAIVGVYGVMSTPSRSSARRSACAWRSARSRARSRGWCSPAARGCCSPAWCSAWSAASLAARIAGAAGLERLAFDPIAFVLVCFVLLVAGLQACLWPALRAGRTDPIIALRME